MTSCGLNGGPLRAEGAYPAAICCNLYNSCIRKSGHTANLPDSSNMPYIGCKNGERCIYDICEDTVIGYKYFDLSPAKALVLRVRGSGSFTVRAGRVVLGQITLPGGKGWQTVRLPFTAQGVHALYLTYSGEGCCDMDEICFE